MLALQPYSVVTREAGESTIRSPMRTSSTLSPRISFIFLQRPSKAVFFSSNAFFSSSLRPRSKPFGHVHELLAVVLLQLLNSVFIDGVSHVDDFEVALFQGFEEGGVLDVCFGLTGDVVDHFLGLLHAVDVLPQGAPAVTGGGGGVSEQLGELVAVL